MRTPSFKMMSSLFSSIGNSVPLIRTAVTPNVLISCLRENQIRRRPDYFNNTVQVNRASPVLAGQLHHLLGGYISRSLGGLLIAVR